MVKHVQSTAGFRTALVAIGWCSFILGLLLTGNPFVSVPLMVIARVLP